MSKVLITGAAGFIGYHLTKKMLSKGFEIVGVDNLNDYYDTAVKQARLSDLSEAKLFKFKNLDISDFEGMRLVFAEEKPQRIVHLAAQAGVRYSIDNPAAYTQSNLVGHANILELGRRFEVEQAVYASSSSIYGSNKKTPFCETDPTDSQVSYYGATKKSNELMAHSYASLYGLPLIGLRFFTVYGPYGRPDMAYWIFARKITLGEPIQVFNNGNMSRDFTYVDDVVDGIIAALGYPLADRGLDVPHRIYNLGNDRPIKLMDLIGKIESSLGLSAQKDFLPMQSGDVYQTWADISRAREELSYNPTVELEQGVDRFVSWYKTWRDK